MQGRIRIDCGLRRRNKANKRLRTLRRQGISLSRENFRRTGRRLEGLALINRLHIGGGPITGRRIISILGRSRFRRLRFHAEIDVQIALVRRQGGLAARHAVVGRSPLAGDSRVLVFRLRRVVNDLRLDVLLRFDLVKLRGLQAPLAGAELAGIDDVARFERQTVEHRGDLGVRILALDLDIDAADLIAGTFVDVVHDVEFARFFEEAVVSLDLGEHVAVAAVLVAELLQIEILLVLVEVLAAEQFQFFLQARIVYFLVAQERDGADGVARSLVDHEGDGKPVLFLIRFQFAADDGMEVAETAVIGGQFGHVLVDLLAVDLAGKQVEPGRMGIDQRFQPG